MANGQAEIALVAELLKGMIEMLGKMQKDLKKCSCLLDKMENKIERREEAVRDKREHLRTEKEEKLHNEAEKESEAEVEEDYEERSGIVGADEATLGQEKLVSKEEGDFEADSGKNMKEEMKPEGFQVLRADKIMPNIPTDVRQAYVAIEESNKEMKKGWDVEIGRAQRSRYDKRQRDRWKAGLKLSTPMTLRDVVKVSLSGDERNWMLKREKGLRVNKKQCSVVGPKTFSARPCHPRITHVLEPSRGVPSAFSNTSPVENMKKTEMNAIDAETMLFSIDPSAASTLELAQVEETKTKAACLSVNKTYEASMPLVSSFRCSKFSELGTCFHFTSAFMWFGFIELILWDKLNKTAPSTTSCSPLSKSHTLEIEEISFVAEATSRLEEFTSLFKAETTSKKGEEGQEQILVILDKGEKKDRREWRWYDGKDGKNEGRKVELTWFLKRVKEGRLVKRPKCFWKGKSRGPYFLRLKHKRNLAQLDPFQSESTKWSLTAQDVDPNKENCEAASLFREDGFGKVFKGTLHEATPAATGSSVYGETFDGDGKWNCCCNTQRYSSIFYYYAKNLFDAWRIGILASISPLNSIKTYSGTLVLSKLHSMDSSVADGVIYYTLKGGQGSILEDNKNPHKFEIESMKKASKKMLFLSLVMQDEGEKVQFEFMTGTPHVRLNKEEDFKQLRITNLHRVSYIYVVTIFDFTLNGAFTAMLLLCSRNGLQIHTAMVVYLDVMKKISHLGSQKVFEQAVIEVTSSASISSFHLEDKVKLLGEGNDRITFRKMHEKGKLLYLAQNFALRFML